MLRILDVFSTFSFVILFCHDTSILVIFVFVVSLLWFQACFESLPNVVTALPMRIFISLSGNAFTLTVEPRL